MPHGITSALWKQAAHTNHLLATLQEPNKNLSLTGLDSIRYGKMELHDSPEIPDRQET